MSTWFSWEVDGGPTYGRRIEKIQEAFWPLFAAAGSPKDMAVFSGSRWVESTPEQRGYYTHTVYFSPAAQQVAESFGAVPCAKPSSASFECGHQEALFIFFPNRTSESP